MLGAYARIVESCTDAFGFTYLSLFVHKEIAFGTVEDADLTCTERSTMLFCIESFSASFYADEFDVFVIYET